jgi:hypothetical protein
MKYILVFVGIFIIGGSVAVSMIGVPAPKRELHIPISLGPCESS